MNSSKSATYFQLSDFKLIPETLGSKKLSQVTNCIKPNDFKPNGIKASDPLPPRRFIL